MAINEERLHGMAQLLVGEGLLDKTSAFNYQKAAQEEQQAFPHYLVTHHILPAKVLAATLAHNFGLPLFDIEAMDLQQIPLQLISTQLIQQHNILPLFARGNHLFLATDDPSKQASFKEIQFHTGLYVDAVVVETDKLAKLIDKLLHQKENQNLCADASEFLQLHGSVEKASSSANEDTPIVKFVNKIIRDAIKKDVSDIHFEPFERDYRIRYRQDGILTEAVTPPMILANRITSRIKIMANLDISERRIPQDGGFKLNLSKTKALDFRVSTCPTIGGEKVVLRILDPNLTCLNIESLGFSEQQKKLFTSNITKPQGMVLVTGPTGSGKTVTLYTALTMLNNITHNILTAEDPVEIKMNGVNQVQINPKAGLTFSNALRSFLRQDPDIIMVGEIRDFETAEIAIKAAQTGHLVLSTLHTNSAAETLTRLVNMGIPAFNIASSVSLVIAQRLARRLCEQCKTIRDDLTEHHLIEFGIQIYKANGCSQCNQGYKGRVGLFEVLPMTKAIGHLMMSGGSATDVLQQAQREGMISIYQSGLDKIKAGVTTIEEVNRVTVD